MQRCSLIFYQNPTRPSYKLCRSLSSLTLFFAHHFDNKNKSHKSRFIRIKCSPSVRCSPFDVITKKTSPKTPFIWINAHIRRPPLVLLCKLLPPVGLTSIVSPPLTLLPPPPTPSLPFAVNQKPNIK